MEQTNPNMLWPKRFELRQVITCDDLGTRDAAEVFALASDSIKRRGLEKADIGVPLSVNRECFAVRVE